MEKECNKYLQDTLQSPHRCRFYEGKEVFSTSKEGCESRDVVFVEDHTIENIVKTKVQVPQQEPLVNFDPIPIAPVPQQAEDDVANDAQDDVHGICDENAP